jgi:DNA-binding MarR family transcriptional regulator
MVQAVFARKDRMSAVAARFDLTLPQVNLLRLLEFGPARNMSSIAEALACDASNVTGIVDRLESRGLIARATGAEDRRVKTITLTPHGKDVLGKLTTGFLEPPGELRGLPLADLKKLHALVLRAFSRRPRG